MVKLETRIQLAIKEILEEETWKHLKTNNNFDKVLSIASLIEPFDEGSFLGKYELKKNNFYRCSIDTLGRNPRLQRNNIWLSRNNLEYLGLPTISESLEIIQKNI